MTLVIKPLRKQDFNQARQFAIAGMNLKRYTGNDIELYLYSKHFWNSEINRTTKAYGAYDDGRFVGVLLVAMNRAQPLFSTWWRRVSVAIVNWLMGQFYSNMTLPYEQANAEMLAEFRKKYLPDGEVLFFAVTPTAKGLGVGTQLLNRLEQENPGKRIYLYTDSSCTYQFYQHRGFEKVATRQIKLNESEKQIALTCFLFSKQLKQTSKFRTHS